MWRTLQDEIQAKATLLTEQGYVFTAKWCNRIRQNLNSYVKEPRELDLDVRDLLSTFENEYLNRTDFGNRDLRRRCLKTIQGIFEWAIRRGPTLKQTFGELVPIAERGIDASKPINEVVNVFRKLDEKFIEARIYGSLFVFMLHVDGQYFPIVRTLCAMKLAGNGKQPKLKQIEKMTLEKMKQILGGVCKPLFEVYDSTGRHLRNSIAHANFRYESGKLSCWDIDPRSKKVIWRRAFTFDELSAIMGDIYSVTHAYLYWYLLRELIDKVAQYIRAKLPGP